MIGAVEQRKVRQYVGAVVLAILLGSAIALARCVWVFEDSIGDCWGYLPLIAGVLALSGALGFVVDVLRKRHTQEAPGWWPRRRSDDDRS